MTESERLSKIDVPVAQFLDVKRLSEKLGKVVRMSQRTDVGAVETILNSEVGCPGIIDTGASKSVIGQRKVKRLIASLPSEARSLVKWGSRIRCFALEIMEH